MTIPLGEGSFDWNLAMPYALGLLIMAIVVFNIVQGLRHGKMRVFRRGEGHDMDDRPALYCHRADSPKTFWALFAFYVIISLLVPCLLLVAYFKQPTDPPTNPGQGEPSAEAAEE